MRMRFIPHACVFLLMLGCDGRVTQPEEEIVEPEPQMVEVSGYLATFRLGSWPADTLSVLLPGPGGTVVDHAREALQNGWRGTLYGSVGRGSWLGQPYPWYLYPAVFYHPFGKVGGHARNCEGVAPFRTEAEVLAFIGPSKSRCWEEWQAYPIFVSDTIVKARVRPWW
jgi:hypothetical protein